MGTYESIHKTSLALKKDRFLLTKLSELSDDEVFDLQSSMMRLVVRHQCDAVGSISFTYLRNFFPKRYLVHNGSPDSVITVRGDRRDDSYVLHFVPFANDEKDGLAAAEVIILGTLDLIRLLKVIDAISDPNELKPKFFLGCTNETMANIAVRKLGFLFLVPTRTDRLTDALFSAFDSEHGNKSEQPKRIFATVQSLHAKIPEMQLKVNKLIERFRGNNSHEEYIRQLRERSIRSLMNYLEMDGLQTVAMIPEMG